MKIYLQKLIDNISDKSFQSGDPKVTVAYEKIHTWLVNLSNTPDLPAAEPSIDNEKKLNAIIEKLIAKQIEHTNLSIQSPSKIATAASQIEETAFAIATLQENFETLLDEPRVEALNTVLEKELQRIANEEKSKHSNTYTQAKFTAFTPFNTNPDKMVSTLKTKLSEAKKAAKSHRQRGFFGILGLIKDNFCAYPKSFQALVQFEAEHPPSVSINEAVNSKESTSCFAFLSRLNPLTCFYPKSNEPK